MRPIVAGAAGVLLLVVTGGASAGTVTPTQYAYGGKPLATGVIAVQPPAGRSGDTSRTGGPASAVSPGGLVGGKGSHQQPRSRSRQRALIGIAASPPAPVASSGALSRSIPANALWAIALALACAVGAWLLRRGRSAG